MDHRRRARDPCPRRAPSRLLSPMNGIDRQLLLIAVPALASNALVPLDEMLQAAIVGQLLGTSSLAACVSGTLKPNHSNNHLPLPRLLAQEF